MTVSFFLRNMIHIAQLPVVVYVRAEFLTFPGALLMDICETADDAS